jgi:hypothetical protein
VFKTAGIVLNARFAGFDLLASAPACVSIPDW